MNPAVVVDTNVVSYVFKRDSRAALYDKHLSGKTAAVSFMTVAELYKWTIDRQWGQSRVAQLRSDLLRYVVLPFDEQLAWEWARVMTIKGRPMESGDAWIAAAAIRHNIPLITHNRSHFEHVPGLNVISEA